MYLIALLWRDWIGNKWRRYIHFVIKHVFFILFLSINVLYWHYFIASIEHARQVCQSSMLIGNSRSWSIRKMYLFSCSFSSEHSWKKQAYKLYIFKCVNMFRGEKAFWMTGKMSPTNNKRFQSPSAWAFTMFYILK